MRREGRLKGFVHSRRSSDAERKVFEQHLLDLGLNGPFRIVDSFDRIKVSNKRTNQSKASGRCKQKACRHCKANPPSKALSKTKGFRNKLYCPKFYISPGALHTFPRTHLSVLDLLDYDCFSDGCDDVFSDEEASDVDYDLVDGIPPDVNEVPLDGSGCSAHGLVADGPSDWSNDRLDTRDDHYASGFQSTLLAARGGVSEAVHSHERQSCSSTPCIHDVVCDDRVSDFCACQDPEALHLVHHDGSTPVSENFPPYSEDGGFEWCLVGRTEIKVDVDGWIIC